MSVSDEARRLQAQGLERRARAMLSTNVPAAAVVHVQADGTLTMACSCGEDLAHPSGRTRYTLQRLTGHMELHATAAAQGVPWDEVRARLDRMTRAPRLLPVERGPRDDDPGE